MFAGDVVKVGNALDFEAIEGRFQRRPILQMVVFHPAGDEKGILHGAVFHQDDGSGRVRGAQFLDAWLNPLRDFRGDHVGQTVQDIDGRIQLGKQAGHFRFHFSIARKAEIDGRPVKAPAQNRAMHHARARRGKSLQNGGSIERNRLAFARPPRTRLFQDCSRRQAQFDKFRAVIQRQIEQIFALARQQVLHQHNIVGLIFRYSDGQPVPAGVHFYVKIQPAFGDGRRVGQV